MTRRQFSREFKREAVHLVAVRGVSVAQAARDLDVHSTVLRRWVKQYGADSANAFPGKGQMTPADDEVRRLRREVAKLKAERDILKKSRGLLREGPGVMFAFIAKHRGIWPVSWMCGALGISRSGFFAWLTRPPSARSRTDAVLAECIRASFLLSDRTYGARRVWHDMLEERFACGLHRIERLMRLHGLRARPRRRQLPRDTGARSVIAPNVLERDFAADGPNRKWVADFTYSAPRPGWSGVHMTGMH